MGFVVYQTTQDVEDFRKYTNSIADHFGSDSMAEKYLNGLIDWDGNEICDYCHGPCKCGALDL